MTKQQFKDRITYLNNELQIATETFLVESFKSFFREFPLVQSVYWEQTVLQFSVDNKKGFYSSHSAPDLTATFMSSDEQNKVNVRLLDIMDSFDDELMNMVFGADISVTVTKDGITIEELAAHGK